MIQELDEVLNGGRNGNLVLPFEFGPHGTEYFVSTGGGADVIHDIHLDEAN